MTRIVVPNGEMRISNRVVHFRCDPPWPRIRQMVFVELGHGVRQALNDRRKWTMWMRAALVRVNEIGGDGWLSGSMVGRASAFRLERSIALNGSNS